MSPLSQHIEVNIMKHLKVTYQERDRIYEALEMYWDMPKALRLVYATKIMELERLAWNMNKVLIR